MTVVMKITPNWSNKTLGEIERGLAEMATDIHTRAVILAPRESGNLIASGRVARSGNMEYTVSFGSARVPYARRRHFENKKNPQTLGYLARAGESVERGDKTKYFRNKVK